MHASGHTPVSDPTSTLHSNDDACFKPQGRQVFEDIKWKTRGQTSRIATWNVRTMFQAGKLDNVIQEMDNMNFDVLGLCETRWTGNGKMIHEGHVLIYSRDRVLTSTSYKLMRRQVIIVMTKLKYFMKR